MFTYKTMSYNLPIKSISIINQKKDLLHLLLEIEGPIQGEILIFHKFKNGVTSFKFKNELQFLFSDLRF